MHSNLLSNDCGGWRNNLHAMQHFNHFFFSSRDNITRYQLSIASNYKIQCSLLYETIKFEYFSSVLK